MSYFKKCAKKKNKIKITNIFLFIIIGFFVFEIFQNSTWNKTESDTKSEDNGIEDCIEKVSYNIVGISKNNIQDENTKWGSGVIASKKGYIVTNEHIAGNENENCDVIFEDKKLKGKVVWCDSQIDLAIIKVNYEFEECIKFGESENTKVGECVYAIGNPLGNNFKKSVTSGIISGLNRNLEFKENGKKMYLNNLIQTDATINSGSSGGALINKQGELIGINTIKIFSAESMNFAMPSNIIKTIIKKLENDENITNIKLGVWIYDKHSIKESEYNIDLNTGVYVATVDKNSIGEISGIKPGDIILSIDGKQVDNVLDFKQKLYEESSKKEIVLEVKRDNKVHLIKINV